MRAYPSVASANWSLWLALPSMLAGCPHPSSLMPVGLPHASKQSANSILRIRILWNHFSSLLRDLIDFAIMRHNTMHLSATPLLLFTSLIFSCLHFFCLVLSCLVLSCLVLSCLFLSPLLFSTSPSSWIRWWQFPCSAHVASRCTWGCERSAQTGRRYRHSSN